MITVAKIMEPYKEQRNKKERRSGIDRRRLNSPKYTGIEKRITPDFRSGRDRREETELWTEMQMRRVR